MFGRGSSILTTISGSSSYSPRRSILRCASRKFSELSELSHVDPVSHLPKMVDVSAKTETFRTARAQANVLLPKHVFDHIEVRPDGLELRTKKGSVVSTAVVAGVMGAKKTAELIPFCHPIFIEGCDISIECDPELPHALRISSLVKTTGKTGIEMEALVAVSTAALCVYDMLKAMSHDIVISNIHLVRKTGGKSDYLVHQQPAASAASSSPSL